MTKRKRSNTPSRFNEADVSWGVMKTGGGHTSRQSRAVNVTMAWVTGTHGPTGISVSGTVPPGRYTRRQMIEAQAKLKPHLLTELEEKVAKARRVPGR
jgi:hypothetical protein